MDRIMTVHLQFAKNGGREEQDEWEGRKKEERGGGQSRMSKGGWQRKEMGHLWAVAIQKQIQLNGLGWRTCSL